MEEVKSMKTFKTHAADYLSVVNHYSTKHDAEKADAFHPRIAKSLFLYNRARPVFQPKLPFL